MTRTKRLTSDRKGTNDQDQRLDKLKHFVEENTPHGDSVDLRKT